MATNNNNNTSSPNLNNNAVIDSDSMKQGNLVVRINQDSDDNLQALFDSVLKPGDTNRPLQVPLRMRKLPDSFFQPPASASKSSSVSHSRANSTDSAFSTGSQTATGGGGAGVNSVQPSISSVPTLANRGLAISHSRAHSSPASLQQNYAGLGGGNTQNSNTSPGTGGAPGTNASPSNPSNPVSQHMKQRSYDVVSAIQLQAELGDLPVGWEQARTPEGQIYYLNHITKTTQWEDPRTQIAQQQAALAQQQQTIQQTAVTQAKETTSDPLGTLPEGWEQAVTSSGEIYFINHINRTTSWFDPRISDYLQRASTLSTRSELSQSNTNNWINIRNLEKEREYLKQRQQEIQHQDLLTRQNQQTMGLQMDPFLSGITDHSRQESGDSGLSLSSNNFSVTPDFLPSIDDGMDCLSESGNMDSLCSSGLDSADDLVPSLQLGDNLCSEMLNDVQSLINSPSTKPDNLNWYKMNIS